MNEFINPEWYWENYDRRTKGCFACIHSKEGKLNGLVQKYCKPEQEGMIIVDYPHEDESTCKMFYRKRRNNES